MDDKRKPTDELENAPTQSFPQGADPMSPLLRELARTPEVFAGSLVPGSRLGGGRYTVGRLIGKGGMGAVYLAVDEVLRKEVALKLVDESIAGNQERLRDEVLRAQEVTHRNVCRTYDLEEVEGHWLVKMEYVDGQTLAEKVATAGPLSVAEARAIARQIAYGLAAAHERGVVHRDLKPQNIVIEKDTHRVVLMDFGLARLAELAGKTAEGVAGTPEYMAPEQARGREVDGRADLYALGCVLYYMLTGQVVFPAETAMAAALRHVEDPAPDVRAARPDTPAWLAQLILSLLEKDPERRPADAAQVVAALAGPPQRWRSVAGLTLLAAAFAGVGLLIWALVRPSPGSVQAAKMVERRLTAGGPSTYSNIASLSRDGRLLAHVSNRSLLLRVLATGEERALGMPAGWVSRVAWFPDNLRLLVNVHTDPGSSLQILSTLGGAPIELAPGADGGGTVSPDGRTIAFFRDAEGTKLWLMDADGQHDRGLVDAAPGHFFQNPAWSPDGRALAIAELEDLGTPRLRTVSMDGTLGAPFAEGSDLRDEFGRASLAWLADGRIVYTRQGGDTSELWAVHVDPTTGACQGEPALMASFVGHNTRIHAADERGHLLTSRIVHSDDVYILDLSADGSAAGEPRPVTRDEWRDFPTSFTADSQFLLFQSLRDGRWQRYRAPVAGDSVIPEGAGEHDSMGARPAPGGVGLVWLESAKAGDAKSWRLMAQSADGTIRVVADLGLSSVLMFMELRCAHLASKGCVVRQQTGAGGGSYRFTHIDPDSGAAVVVAHVDFPMRGWDLSPAGDEIAYVRMVNERTGRLITIALADGVIPLDVPLYGHMQDLAYDPSGRNFIATEMINISPRYHIARVDRRGDPDLIWGNPLDWLSRPVVSPDGRHIAFTRAAMSQNLWMLSGL